MNSKPFRVTPRFCATVALLLALCSASSFAAETTVDQTRFKLRTAQGAIEVVQVENLQPGETRSLQTEAGTPVIVGRHEGGYVIDIAGERIEVDSPQVLLSDGSAPLLLDGADGKHVVVKVDRKHSKDAGAADQDSKTERKVVMIKRKAHGDGAGNSDGSSEISIIDNAADAQALLDGLNVDDPELAEGQRVMVVRKIEKRQTQD